MQNLLLRLFPWLFLLILSTTAMAEPKLDLALVLAVDVSSSMDPNEQRLQREGFIEAFRSPRVHKAIQKGILGRIAVTYLEWSATDDQTIIVPWTVIDGPDAATNFARKLAYQPTRRGTTTSISSAIDFSAKLFGDVDGEAARHVIDLSGDGPNNDGSPVTQARDQALANGITINGLPIMIKGPDAGWDMDNLDLYYRDCVIGGPGSFMQPIQDADQFAALIEIKIIREISDLRGQDRLSKTAGVAVDCQTGEKKRQEDSLPGRNKKP